MFARLTNPIKRKVDGAKAKVHGFVDPIKSATCTLLGKIPMPKLSGSNPQDGSASDPENGESQAPKGLLARLKAFKQSLKDMSDLQKIILLTIAVCVPAGILISTILVGFIKKQKKK